MRMLILLGAIGSLYGTPGGEKLELRNGYPIVKAYLNGQGPFRMLVDTGNTSTWVTPEVGKRIGLTYHYRVVVSSLAGDRIAPAARNVPIRVGAAESMDVEVIAIDFPGVRGLGGDIDGILGQNFLGRFPYLIDYRSGRILFAEQAVRQAGKMPALPARSVAGRMAVDVSLDGAEAPFRLVLDSGASHMLVFCGPRCPHLSGVRGDAIAVSNGGSQRVRRGTVRQASLGGVRFTNREAALIDTSPDEGDADGLLPARWFSAVYVNAGRGEVRLAR